MSDTEQAPDRPVGFKRSVMIGVTIAEQVGNGAWKGSGSHPSWIIGEGHVSVAEARAKAVEAVTAAEKTVDDMRAALAESIKELTAAIRKRTAAQSALDDARLTLGRAQMDLARRCGVVEEQAQ